MKALLFDGPWQLAHVDRPEPVLGSHDALIRVLGTGVCGSDIHGYSGETGRRVADQVMGHETVGQVVATGSEVDDVRIGSTVTINPILGCRQCDHCSQGLSNACADHRVIGVDPTLDGSFADLLAVPAKNVVALSDSVPVLHGALVEPLAVGYHAVCRGGIQGDDSVLIIGGGPIGQAAAIAARRLGIERILVSELTLERRQLLHALGFEAVAPDNLSRAVKEVLGGAATKVVDAVGIDVSLEDAVTYSSRRAAVVLVGMGAKQISISAYPLSVGERAIVGSYCYSEDHFRQTAAWVSEGQPELDLLLDEPVPLVDGPEVFRSLADGSGPTSKVILVSQAGPDGGPRA